MLNRITWSGLIVMAAAVLLYLGEVLTTFTRPALPWIASVGGVLFVGGIVLAIVHRFATTSTEPEKTPSPPAEPSYK
jgi:hypothetical protein